MVIEFRPGGRYFKDGDHTQCIEIKSINQDGKMFWGVSMYCWRDQERRVKFRAIDKDPKLWTFSWYMWTLFQTDQTPILTPYEEEAIQ